MSTLQNRNGQPILTRGAGFVLTVLAGYFAILLIPYAQPAFRGTGFFFLYAVSLPVILVVLIGVGLWSAMGLLRSRRSGVPANSRHRLRFTFACLAVLLFGSIFGVARAIKGALPTGSYLRQFDRDVWQRPDSTAPVDSDITPRQQMLGDLLKNILPGRSRAEIEDLLGPSLETSYCADYGCDLIFMLGPQRDSLFPIDSESLVIWLDDSGRFDRYGIYTD